MYVTYSLCMTYTVEVTGLTKTFGSTPALGGVDLRIEQGTVYGLLGPNGAGKTTLVRILSTLVRPDSGTARVVDHDLIADADAVRRSIGLTGQYAAVDDVLTGSENLMMMALLRKLPASAARRRTAELLEEFDLLDAADRRAGHLLRRHEAPARPRGEHDRAARAALPRRTDDRARPAQP